MFGFINKLKASLKAAKVAFVSEWKDTTVCGKISMAMEQVGSACIPGVVAIVAGAPIGCVWASMAVGYFGVRWLVKNAGIFGAFLGGMAAVSGMVEIAMLMAIITWGITGGAVLATQIVYFTFYIGLFVTTIIGLLDRAFLVNTSASFARVRHPEPSLN
jgi:hypothetical protein